MEPDRIIYAFLQWLHENPSIFMPAAWQDLPKLQTEIAESADDELFPIAMTISKWCAFHQLGEDLKNAAAKCKKEIEDVGEITSATMQPLTNITQTLRTSIEDSYKKLLETAADNKSDTSNESK